MLRGLEDRVRRAGLDDPTLRHHGDAVFEATHAETVKSSVLSH
ncbi:hypothetical protein ACW9J6_19050 [Methylobacterium sp. JK268]